MLEADHVLHDESKERLKKEYIRRVKKCLKSKLNGGNMVKAINTWAVSLMRYSSGIVEWTKADLDVTDRKTRKLMTMYGMLHPLSNVSRLYLLRSEGGRGLLSVSDSVNIERSLQCHVSSTQEKLLKVAQKYIKADELDPKEFYHDNINFIFKIPFHFFLNVLKLKFLFGPEIKVTSAHLKVIYLKQ